MSFLRYISLVSIVSIIYIFIVMLVELPQYWKEYYSPEEIDYFLINWNFFVGASITFFSYTCQASIIPIYSELVAPNKRRMMKIIGRSLAIDCALFWLVALVGYFSTFSATPQVVISRIPLTDPDYAITVGCIGVIIVVLISSPANFFPFKNTLNFIIYNSNEIGTFFNIACTVAFCTTTCVVSIVFPNVSSALSITGGFSSVGMCYLVPLWCWIKLSKQKWYVGWNLWITVSFVALTLIGWISIVVTIYQLVDKDEPDTI
mmetsp:Transcript_9979/g.7506  ORF Transcript_9979/g.7506 Transcript_9979/m.7506 type:complete len:261 (+) Transcript_9979:707-1489(+)